MKLLAQWAETVTSIVLAIVFSLVHKPDLAYVSIIIGTALTASRYLYSRKIEDEVSALQFKIIDGFAPAYKLAGIVDLQKELAVDKLRDIVRIYLDVEPEFRQIKEDVVSEAIAKLTKLAHDKRSDVLTPSVYYHWLLPTLADAMPGATIWAISTMLDFEWDDTPFERNFLDLNLQAVRRGVDLERIFVLNTKEIDLAVQNAGIAAHLSNACANLRPLVVDRELVAEREPSLLQSVGAGMIAFDRRVALIDVVSEQGMRGYVVTNETEINRLRQTYENLRIYASELKDVVNSRARQSSRSALTEPTP